MNTILNLENHDGSGIGSVKSHAIHFILITGQVGWVKSHANHFYPVKHYGAGMLIQVSWQPFFILILGNQDWSGRLGHVSWHPIYLGKPLCTQKNYGTHVIKLDIAPKTYPLGQHLFISASNNMFYRHSQWDKSHTICVVNLMPQDTKIVFLNRSCVGLNLQPSGWVSDTLPQCHICLVQMNWNWIYLELNIFQAFILPTPFPISRADKSLSSNPSLKKISATHVIKLGFEDISTRAIQVL